MIEPAGAEAAELLGLIHARAFDDPWSGAEIAKLIENPAVFVLLARGVEPQGFAMSWAAASDSELLTIAVVPEARRRGVAAALVVAAETAARLRGATSMHLEVAEDNVAARALYEKLGYEEAGRRNGYYARNTGFVDAIVMRRTLPA